MKNKNNNEEEELVSQAVRLLLVQLKLNKVHEEVMKFHTEKESRSPKSTVFLISCLTHMMIILFVIVSLRAKMNNAKKEERDDEAVQVVANDAIIFTSPTPKLTRELSSLDKKNIFPSTVRAPLVQKDGTLTEVKRTMRFSPEVKRFSPEFKMKVTRVPSLNNSNLNAAKQQKHKQKQRTHVERKRAMFNSPELKMKMKPIKEFK
eukprot:CAMPEP_0203703830 /NCGR_PEP_ID=MMETSP0091-20130426/44495_1 /ASSEMBLY_ACC=CAM_ASM_001089 /TAXON_ID=426623 /ORGANISM="Chaetoceros affinis, Strain CCMP159" /LENGTH=204 /DNA_ID=CAMNT_0050578623 /DNA_START=85 /DNA_END=699 /DNA_ORIENTATION=-